MLRTLLTKEIKLFHSCFQVGLAYMVAAIFERKKRHFFSTGYFGCRHLVSFETQTKLQFLPPRGLPWCIKWLLRSQHIPRFSFLHHMICTQRAVQSILQFLRVSV